MKIKTFLPILLMLMGCFFGEIQAQVLYSPYKQIPVAGDGNWDYLSVDSKNRNLYLSHGDRVDIVNVDRDEVIGSIGDQHGVHGIAIDLLDNKGFISNGKSSDVTVFDLKTRKVLAHVPSTGTGVDAITYNPLLDYVLVHNSKSHSITVIDGKTNAVKGTIDAQGKTEFGVSDLKGFYYVNLEAEGKIAKIDLKKMKVVTLFELKPDHDPAGMAIDLKNNLLFCGARSNNLVVLDASNGNIITTVPIGDHNDAVVFDPESKFIYVSSILADITIIHQESRNTYKLVQHVNTKLFSKTMALDMKTKKVYLPSADWTGSDEKTAKIIPGTFKALVFKK